MYPSLHKNSIRIFVLFKKEGIVTDGVEHVYDRTIYVDHDNRHILCRFFFSIANRLYQPRINNCRRPWAESAVGRNHKAANIRRVLFCLAF